MFTLVVMHNGPAPEAFHAKRQADQSYHITTDDELVRLCREQREHTQHLERMLDQAERDLERTREEWRRLCWQEGHVQSDYRVLLETLSKAVSDMEEAAEATIENDPWQRGRRDAWRAFAHRLRALLKPAQEKTK